jgi:predicted O-linked N-acetylglucosamine transferase (SPINDLY family)
LTAPERYERAAECHRAGRLDEAIAGYRESLALDGQFHPAWYAQGCAFEAKGNHATAVGCFQQAVACAPDHRESHHNLGKALFALGLVDEALESFQAALTLGGGFLSRTAIATIIPGSPRATNASVLAARREWAKTHVPAPEATRRFPRLAPPQGRRLRVGYLSSFFADHKWMKPVWGLVNHHDRDRVEIELFSDAPESECLPGYRKDPRDRFHDISGLSNQATAQRIEASQLDVLVDLNGYSRVDRLAVTALKPAPILAGWFNFYATSGMVCYDYLIGDQAVIPPVEEPCYLERILRVPGSYLSFEVTHPAPEVAEPPNLTTGAFTFGCLASCYKITPPVVEAWARILQGAPRARLFVKNSALGCPENRKFLAERFTRCGVHADRIAMEEPADHFDFLGAYRHIDVALDPFPYNGGTTTMEALWQGVPVLTFGGDRWAARQSASILCAAGLAEYVAETMDDYVERAVALARAADALPRLAELRRGMRQHLARSSICDAASFARNMEELYAHMIACKAADSWCI